MTGNAKPLGDLIFKHYTLSLSMTSSIRTHFHRFGDWFSQTYPGLLLKNIGKTVKQFSEPCLKKTFIASASLRIHYLEIPGDSFITWRASIPGVWKIKHIRWLNCCKYVWANYIDQTANVTPKKVVLVRESPKKILSLGVFFIGCLNSGIRIAQIFVGSFSWSP